MASSIGQDCQTIVLSNLADIVSESNLTVKGDAAMGCAASFCVAAGANTEVCPDAFHGCRGRDSPACAPDAGVMHNSAVHLGRRVVS